MEWNQTPNHQLPGESVTVESYMIKTRANERD